jgi:hypothetical protein
MGHNYHSILITSVREPFEGSDVRTDSSIEIKFFNKAGRILMTERYGVPSVNQLKEFYKEQNAVVLDNLYLKNFNLSEITGPHGGEGGLDRFSAVNTFFDSDDITDFSNLTLKGDINFINSHFAHGNVTFYKTIFNDGAVDFTDVNFGNGDVNFQFVEFGDGDISFENSIFGEGNISFVNTHFGSGKVNFKNTNFGTGNVDFHFAKFVKGDISFDKAVFGGPSVDFRRVEFGDGKLDFTRTDFGDGDVNFEETEYGKGRKNFKRAIFGRAHVSFELAQFGQGEVNFENAEFEEGKLSFFKSVSESISLKNCQLNNYLDLRVESCGLIDLSNTIVKDIIDLKPGFSKVVIKQLNITGVRNLGKIFIDWQYNEVYNLIAGQDSTTYAQKADQFRIIKEDFNSEGRYDDEDKAYVEFKRFELLSYKEQGLKKKKGKLGVHLNVFFQKLIFDKMGLYATNPLRVWASMLIVYVVFSLLFFVMPYIGGGHIANGLSPENIEPMHSFFLSLYYSAITFFTIGYGDYFPYGAMRWLACAEGFCGVFMMSYFTVAFVRKILR